MKQITTALMAMTIFSATIYQSNVSASAILAKEEVQAAIAAATTMVVGVGASLFKYPSAEFLTSFSIMGLLQLMPELMEIFTKNGSVVYNLTGTVHNISRILPLYNLLQALRAITKEEPDFAECGNKIKSALRNAIALFVAAGCKQLGLTIYHFVAS